MTALLDRPASLRLRPPVDALLRSLRTRGPVVVDQRDDYLALRPCPDGAIALFASADRVAIAVDPAKGYEIADRPPFGHVVPRTPVTAYVVVSARDVADSFDDVLHLALDSLAWRAGPRAADSCARCGVGCATTRDPCPKCWSEIDEHGRCLCSERA